MEVCKSPPNNNPINSTTPVETNNNVEERSSHNFMAEFHERFAPHEIQLMPLDGPTMQRFLECQATFRHQLKPIKAQTAFHYTDRNNIDSIRQQGLTVGESRNGARFGKGIYACRNPHAFSQYGNVGILVLMLPGVSKQRISTSRDGNLDYPKDVDSYLGNKRMKHTELYGLVFPKSPYHDEIVLVNGRQVLPVCWFPGRVLKNKDLMYSLTCFWQKLADEHLNDNIPTEMERVIPTKDDLEYQRNFVAAMQKKYQQNFSHSSGNYTTYNTPKGNNFNHQTPKGKYNNSNYTPKGSILNTPKANNSHDKKTSNGKYTPRGKYNNSNTPKGKFQSKTWTRNP